MTTHPDHHPDRPPIDQGSDREPNTPDRVMPMTRVPAPEEALISRLGQLVEAFDLLHRCPPSVRYRNRLFDAVHAAVVAARPVIEAREDLAGALEDAIAWRTDIGWCGDCQQLAPTGESCPDHTTDHLKANAYDAARTVLFGQATGDAPQRQEGSG